jgi:hypothetical protein
MYSRSAKGGEKGDQNRNPWLAVIASQSESFCYTYVGELKMAAPSEEKLICDKFNLEAKHHLLSTK